MAPKPGEVVYKGLFDATCTGCGRWRKCAKIKAGWFCRECLTKPRLDEKGPRWKPVNPVSGNPEKCQCGATVRDPFCFCDSLVYEGGVWKQPLQEIPKP